MASKCGDCAQWINAILGRKLNETEWERACLVGGKLVRKDTPADPFCFIRRVEVIEKLKSRANTLRSMALRLFVVR